MLYAISYKYTILQPYKKQNFRKNMILVQTLHIVGVIVFNILTLSYGFISLFLIYFGVIVTTDFVENCISLKFNSIQNIVFFCMTATVSIVIYLKMHKCNLIDRLSKL